MTLYIRNTTRQAFEFHVRLPEMGKVYLLPLHPKNTREIRNFNKEQLEAVLSHLQKYGAVARSNLRGKVDDYSGIVYSLDKPISDDDVVLGYNAVIAEAEKRAGREATRAALSSAGTIIKNTRAKSAETTMQQERPIPGEKPATMGITVDATMPEGASDRVLV